MLHRSGDSGQFYTSWCQFYLSSCISLMSPNKQKLLCYFWVPQGSVHGLIFFLYVSKYHHSINTWITRSYIWDRNYDFWNNETALDGITLVYCSTVGSVFALSCVWFHAILLFDSCRTVRAKKGLKSVKHIVTITKLNVFYQKGNPVKCFMGKEIYAIRYLTAFTK